MTYPEYDQDTQCVKCGNREASTRYEPAIQTDTHRTEERLRRVCIRCGYEWYESVLPLNNQETIYE